jgi:hypothetical protein
MTLLPVAISKELVPHCREEPHQVRARSHCRTTARLLTCIPYSQTYSVPLFLKRRCHRTLHLQVYQHCLRARDVSVFGDNLDAAGNYAIADAAREFVWLEEWTQASPRRWSHSDAPLYNSVEKP